MPVIMISIDATGNAAQGIERVASSLGTLDRGLGSLASTSSRTQSALDAQANAYLRLDSATARLNAQLGTYDSAVRRAALANDSYQGTLAKIASSTGDTTALQERAERQFIAVAAAQDRATMAGLSLARAYQQVDAAQSRVGMAGERVQRTQQEPAGGGGGGFGIGGLKSIAGQFLVYQMGYQLANDVMQGFKEGFTNNLALSQTLAMTQATTGVSTPTINTLRQYALSTAGGGQSQYDSNTIAQGAYAVLSSGIKDPTAMKAVTEASRMAATASGSPDLSSFSSALIHSLSAYGVPQGQMSRMAMPFMDQIMQAVNAGIVQPTDVPGAVGVFGGTAAMAGVKFSDVMGLFAQNTLISRSSDQSAQNVDAFLRNVEHPALQQRRIASQLGLGSLFGPQAFHNRSLSDWFNQVGHATAGGNQQLLLQGLLGNVDAVALAQGFIGPGGSNMGRSLGFLAGARGAGGETKSAFDQYQQSDAAKFADANVAFKTSVQQFASAATPLATAMLQFGTGLLNSLFGGGDHGPSHPRRSLADVQAGYAARYAARNTPRVGAESSGAVEGIGRGIRGGHGSMDANGVEIGATDTAAQARAVAQITSLSGRRNNIGVSDAEARLTLAMQEGKNIPSALGIALEAIKESTLSGVQKTLESDRIKKLVEGTATAGPAAAAFRANQAGLGSLLAGDQSTAVRFGSGAAPQTAEIRKLQQELREANGKIAGLLERIATILGQRGMGESVHPLLHVGGSRSALGRG